MKLRLTALAVLLATGAAVSAPAADLAPISSPELAKQLANRWLTSARPRGDWAEVDFSARGWTPAAPAEAVPFPEAILAAGGASRFPLEPGRVEWLQHLFTPFWSRSAREGGPRIYFRRPFEFTEAFAGCASYVAAEGPYEFFVNGRRVGTGERQGAAARHYPIDRLLGPGRNVLGLAVSETSGANAALVWTDLHQSFPVGAEEPMEWLCTTRETPGWEKPGFEPRGWLRAERVAFDPHFHLRGKVGTEPIWHPELQGEPDAVYFRYPLRLEGVPNWGVVDIVADNGWELYVNGELMGVEKRLLNPAVPRSIEINRALRPGKNVIAVKGYNYGGPAALACLPRVKVSF